jgi:hypothetical protein
VSIFAAILHWLAALLSRAPAQKDKPVDVLGTIEDLANLSPTSKSLIGAAVSLGKNDGPGFMAAFHAHDWKTVAYDVVKAELTLAAAVPGPQQPAAALALELLPLGIAFVKYAAANGHNSGEGGIGRKPEGEGLGV